MPRHVLGSAEQHRGRTECQCKLIAARNCFRRSHSSMPLLLLPYISKPCRILHTDVKRMQAFSGQEREQQCCTGGGMLSRWQLQSLPWRGSLKVCAASLDLPIAGSAARVARGLGPLVSANLTPAVWRLCRVLWGGQWTRVGQCSNRVGHS